MCEVDIVGLSGSLACMLWLVADARLLHLFIEFNPLSHDDSCLVVGGAYAVAIVNGMFIMS